MIPKPHERRQEQRASGASAIEPTPSDPNELTVFDTGEALRPGRDTGQVAEDDDTPI